MLNDRDDPAREAYLRRFADQEGREYLDRFWREYHGRSPAGGARPAGEPDAARPAPARRRVSHRCAPTRRRPALGAFLAQHLPQAAIDDDELWDLYREFEPEPVSLRDRGYIAGVHPLELWLVTYLQDHPTRRGPR